MDDAMGPIELFLIVIAAAATALLSPLDASHL